MPSRCSPRPATCSRCGGGGVFVREDRPRGLEFYLESNNGLFASEGFEEGALDAIREYSARKGEGLRFAAATMGVPLADTVAVGDSDNDLTMIEAAGIGIAMGNGEQCVKDAADWVTDAVDASGLAHAFERLGVV